MQTLNFSSEDEEDEKHPDSIKTKMKRIYKEALNTDICKQFEKLQIDDVAECTTAMAQVNIKQFVCSRCGHIFSLRKTRDRHQNVCKK